MKCIYHIHTDEIIAKTDPKRFLGFCIDADQFEDAEQESCLWELKSPVVQNLCRELAPATIRLGGSGIERIEFVENQSAPHKMSDPHHFLFDHEKADAVGEFCRATNADLMLSIPIRDGDVENAIRMADYFIHERKDPVPFIEMGNEPDWGWGASGKLYTERVTAFYEAMKERFPDQKWIGGYGGRSYPFGICHPDSDAYREFVAACGSMIDIFSTHYYTCSANRDYSSVDFMLDRWATDIKANRVNELNRILHHAGLGQKEITINEFNTFASQGIDGVSNAMPAAVWLADIVGNMAKAGSPINNIQCGFGRKHGHYEFWRYAMIDTSDHQIRINPHFYAFYLWSRMMGNEHLLSYGANTHPVTCHATRRDGCLRIMLINKDPDESHEVELQIAALPASALRNFEIYSLNSEANPNNAASINGAGVDATGCMAAVPPQAHTVEQDTLSVSVPACSVLVVSIREAS